MDCIRLSFELLALSVRIWTLGEVMMAINAGVYLASHTAVNFRGRFQSFRELSSIGGRILSPLLCGAIITRSSIHVSWLVVAAVTAACAAGFVGLHRWETRIASWLAATAAASPEPTVTD